MKFLELQDKEKNGFEKMNIDTLKRRFGCDDKRDKMVENILIDIETLKENNEFNVMLGFINTQNLR